MTTWATKKGMMKQLHIREEDFDKDIHKIIETELIEEKDGKYRINDTDGKAKQRINAYLDQLKKEHGKEYTEEIKVDLEEEKVSKLKKMGHVDDNDQFTEKGNKNISKSIDRMLEEELVSAIKR